MTLTVHIAKNVYGGDGLGRLGDGRVIFVPSAWAGESIKATIFEEKKHFVRAHMAEILDPSPDRCAPDDPTLPGMVYSGLTFAGESRAKDEQLADFFARARIPVGTFVPADVQVPERNYRNKVVYHFARQKGKWVFGYRLEPSHEIVDVTNDPLAVQAINDKLPEIRRSVMTLLTTGPESVRRDVERKGKLTIRWTFKTGVKWWLGDAQQEVVLKEHTADLDFEVPADGFYQVNPVVGETLVRDVVAAYREGAEAAPDVLDLYCGVGVFGLCCRHAVRCRVTGVESGRQAIQFAERNAKAQGVTDASFHTAQVGQCLKRLPVGPQTTVIVDPPRGGMEPQVPKWLATCGAARILYVSCDPATLIRDVRTLARAYEVVRVKRYNMFPRTARFETLVVLARKA